MSLVGTNNLLDEIDFSALLCMLIMFLTHYPIFITANDIYSGQADV